MYGHLLFYEESQKVGVTVVSESPIGGINGHLWALFFLFFLFFLVYIPKYEIFFFVLKTNNQALLY